MKPKKAGLLFATIAGGLALTGCGFKPIYAVSEDGSASINQRVAIGVVNAPEDLHPLIVSALADRIALKKGETAQYELTVDAKETAERLAVQIDATVTRYNYRLNARYGLRDLSTGETTKGRARAVTSYNIVSSQYSTLFAERTAQEKAARLLAEEIERDLLIRFSQGFAEDGMEAGIARETELDGETELLPAPGDDPIDFIQDR